MYPDHYSVPDNLNIRLIGYVRWTETERGHHITTLWRDTEGNDYYCEDLWTPYTAPFWFGTRMSDLIQCTSEEFAEHAEAICHGIEELDDCLSAYYRYRELMAVWGCAKGMEIGFAWIAEAAHDEPPAPQD